MKVLSFGELLFDIIGENRYIGGAPFNVAAHLAKLGAESYILSSVGSDDFGREALENIHDLKMKTDFINTTGDYPTGTVTVTLRNSIPSYIIHEDTAWDHIELSDSEFARLTEEGWDLFIYGTLAQRTRENRNLLDKLRNFGRFKAVFYDVNLREPYYKTEWILSSLESSTIVKINDEEAVKLGDMLYNREMSPEEFAAAIHDEYDLDLVCVTFGADGAAVMSENGWVRVPAAEADVKDTVGAGDSFSAAFLYSLYKGMEPGEALTRGCRLGGYVASCDGAIPEYTPSIID